MQLHKRVGNLISSMVLQRLELHLTRNVCNACEVQKMYRIREKSSENDTHLVDNQKEN